MGEKSKEYDAKYRNTHRKEVRESKKRWRENHREQYNAIQKPNNKKRREARIDTDIKNEYSGICPYCNKLIEKGHIDHIIPISKGGIDERSNKVWTCSACNLKKGNKSLLCFMLSVL